MLLKLQGRMKVDGDVNIGMFKVLPAWIDSLVNDVLWRKTGGEIEWEVKIDIVAQNMSAMKDEERFQTMM